MQINLVDQLIYCHLFSLLVSYADVETVERISTSINCNETWLVASWDILQESVQSVNGLFYQCNYNGTEVHCNTPVLYMYNVINCIQVVQSK